MLMVSILLAAVAADPAAPSADPAPVLKHYEQHEAVQLVPRLLELIRFPTVAGNDTAHAAQKSWLARAAQEMNFTFRDAGKITEIELPGPAGAPVLGLVTHGDVQPAEASAWSTPPFAGQVIDGQVVGRGSADDKGPIVQALLAMKALAASGTVRTHTVRLLVGSTEESDPAEIPEYLKTHAAPDYSLVLDSEFPVVVGEKAWDALAIGTPLLAERPGSALPYAVSDLRAGLAPSIVPDRATVTLRWKAGAPGWARLTKALREVVLPEGTRLDVAEAGDLLNVTAHGRSAHAGVNLSGGRNALVALARALEGRLPAGGANDLLAFAHLAGQDLHGTGLEIRDQDPLWGRYAVNVATIQPAKADPASSVLTINLRRIPPRTAQQARTHLHGVVAGFNLRTGSTLTPLADAEWFNDEPTVFDPNARLVRRLMAAYARATGAAAKPAISGGGTYAKRLPNAIAFGMWFPDKPYPGHDVDEKLPVEDLHRGARVLIHTLVDLATGPKIEDAFRP